MKQIGHTWIAIRAIGLIQEDPQSQNLAEILLPWVKHASLGCWLPDQTMFKKGHGVVGNHTFKNAPYTGKDGARFVLQKADLLKGLDKSLALYEFIDKRSSLDQSWWAQPYKAEQKAGEHLPDCLSSLFDTITDMLLLGNPEVHKLVPGTTDYGGYLDPVCALSKEQVSTFFFMLSHYTADCFMPCHADKRKICTFTEQGVHCGWEEHWEDLIGPYFAKDKLKTTPDELQQVVSKAKEMDAKLNLTFPLPLTWPKTNQDIWDHAIFWCRAAFALACNIFPPVEFPYDGDDQLKFDQYFTDPETLTEYDRIVLQSAVYAVASTWKQIWGKFTN